MSDAPITTSVVISFAQSLEERSGAYYQALAERFPQKAVTLRGYAQDCAKTSVQIARTYQETVSDALETGFSFAGLDLASHEIDWSLPAGAALAEVIALSVEREEEAIAFYTEVAAQSGGLLATIPRAFERAAKVRRRRKRELEGLGA